MNVTESKHWRWVPGMLTPLGRLCLKKNRAHGSRLDLYLPGGGSPGVSLDAPDLTDPATIGCIEHLAREAWGTDFLEVTQGHLGWAVFATSSPLHARNVTGLQSTIGVAWAAALLAAP